MDANTNFSTPADNAQSAPAYVFDDGGREAAGYKGKARDCAVRACAIALELPYQQVYDDLNVFCKAEKLSKRRRGKSDSRTGVHRITLQAYLESKGWKWVPTMKVGQGCTTHLCAEELPGGRVIARLSKHYVAVIDGLVRDNHDSSREGTRCVYGYFVEKRADA